jgi:hypothetical protein
MKKEIVNKNWQVVATILLVCVLPALRSNAGGGDGAIARELEQRIDAWMKYRLTTRSSSDFSSNEYYDRIVELGPPALPYLIDRMEKGDWTFSAAIGKITLKRFADDERPKDYGGSSQSYANAVLQWWPKARKETPKRFDALHSRWKTLKSQGKEDQAREQSQAMRGLGVAGLPLLMAKINEGDRDLVPIVSELTRKEIDPNATPAQCVSWWQTNKDKWAIPFPNGRPVAKAGAARSATAGESVQLDASASTDPDGDDLSYTWTQVSGPRVTLSDAGAAKATFKAPEVNQQTVLEFRLVVDDAGDLSKAVPTPNSKGEAVTVKITVNPKK